MDMDYSEARKYSDRHGVHVGPYYDGRFKLSLEMTFTFVLKVPVRFIRWFFRTCRVGYVGKDLEERLTGESGVVFAYWHRYAQFYYFFAENRHHSMMISHKDGGELGARCMDEVGVVAVRGAPKKISKSSGRIKQKQGMEALATLQDMIREGKYHTGLTVDGPSGPELKMKNGAIALARDTGAPILVMTMAARPKFRLFTWDRMWITAPFSKVLFIFTGPFYVPADADEKQLEQSRLEVEAHMVDMAHKADRYWKDKSVRDSLPPPTWNR